MNRAAAVVAVCWACAGSLAQAQTSIETALKHLPKGTRVNVTERDRGLNPQYGYVARITNDSLVFVPSMRISHNVSLADIAAMDTVRNTHRVSRFAGIGFVAGMAAGWAVARATPCTGLACGVEMPADILVGGLGGLCVGALLAGVTRPAPSWMRVWGTGAPNDDGVALRFVVDPRAMGIQLHF